MGAENEMKVNNLTTVPTDVIFTQSNLVKVTKTKTDIYASWTSAKNGSNGTHEHKPHQMTAIKRTDNISTLKKSFKRNRDLINCNFTGADNELFVTLTYADRARGKNIKVVNADFDRFIKRIKRKTHVNTVNLVWFAALEPQADGTWHLHCLLKWQDRKRIFIANAKLSKLWGCGFTKTTAINNVTNIGAYLTAYLTNIIIDPTTNNMAKKSIKWTTNHEHMVQKGGRLGYYRAFTHIGRHSRNCKQPKTCYMTADRFNQMLAIEGWKCTGAKAYDLLIPRVNQDDFGISIKQKYYRRDPATAEKIALLLKLAKQNNQSVTKMLNGKTMLQYLGII